MLGSTYLVTQFDVAVVFKQYQSFVPEKVKYNQSVSTGQQPCNLENVEIEKMLRQLKPECCTGFGTEKMLEHA